jgi:hypothetical protein
VREEFGGSAGLSVLSLQLVPWWNQVLPELASETSIGYQNTTVPNRRQIRHPARSLKPHRRGPDKIGPPKARIACQSLEPRMTNSIPPEPCGKVSGEMGASGGIFLPHPSPSDVIKAPDPLSLLPTHPRGTWNPLARW